MLDVGFDASACAKGYVCSTHGSGATSHAGGSLLAIPTYCEAINLAVPDPEELARGDRHLIPKVTWAMAEALRRRARKAVLRSEMGTLLQAPCVALWQF